jgi:hypothetical protein
MDGRGIDPLVSGMPTEPNLLERRRQKDLARIVLPTHCNCVDEGLPYCGRPECDVDWCWYCGDEYSEPCPRHVGVGRP